MAELNQDILRRLDGLKPGATLNGTWHRWTLKSLLGCGGMGYVVEAEPVGERLARPVALKLGRQSLGGAILREGDAVSWTKHPNLVRIDVAGEHNGVFYLVGLARDATYDANGTKKGAGNGTVIYRAPERFHPDHRKRKSTYQTDVFAFGLTAAALATGKDVFADVLKHPDFDRESQMGKVVGGVEARAKALAAGLDDACPGLAEVVEKCLCVSPAARYPDGAHVHEALKRVLAAQVAEADTKVEDPGDDLPLPERRRWVSRWVVGAGGTLALGSMVGLDLYARTAGFGWSDSLVMKSIPAAGVGAHMGSVEGVGQADEHPRHPVVLSAFFAMEHEVTQGEWGSLMGPLPAGQLVTGAKVPVAGVSWCDAVVYANALTAQANRDGAGLVAAYTVPLGFVVGLGVATCNTLAVQATWVPRATGYRLPTEAEWEWMARAGTRGRFEYSGGATVTEVGWTSKNSGSKPHDVCTASVPRNGYGLCDLSGNVWEWTWDWYDSGFYDTVEASSANPTGPHSGTLRVARGGGWNFTAVSARVAFRGRNSPGLRYGYLGFRLVRSSGPL